jgi:hypothetical protein
MVLHYYCEAAMKYTRYVARTIMGDGMTHWYAYWNQWTKEWETELLSATFYNSDAPPYLGSSWLKFTMIEVDIEIKEKA